MPDSSTSEEILRCARRLITTGGYNGFSYADISAVVGIRKASIHHHFPTKADLVTTLVSQYRKEAEAGLAAMGNHFQSPSDLLRAYTGYWEKCFADSSDPFCVCALLAGQMPGIPEEVATQVRAYFHMLTEWVTSVLERGVADKQFRLSAPAAVEAGIFVATIHGAMISARAYGDGQVFHAIVQPTFARLTG
ncbi:TetR/AcrR family transcriptional regulator [Luteolibacter yonseiensis]|uniref:TetR/AcrR family transcriptional regulator n=1 Tax=Luteolibacter yonseiensis TaxID=1144680 RepID=A0A934R7M5_9BACT|nr:TetR/AcrR family transcriptional regulator [Luteolibacter yonseiensis]MBK1817802.1 TetR/AcrR family transcriptional regulator [Luteolibacter yonseiensis]